MIWYLLRYTRQRPPELVAVVHDLSMALAWVRSPTRPPHEFRRYTIVLDE